MKIDNFALTMHQACPAKYKLAIKDGWSPRRKSGALGFGAAFHEGLAAWYKNKGLQGALLAINEAWEDGPADDYRTKEKCLQTMIEYARNYPTENFQPVQGPDGPFIEVPFTIDTGMTCDEELCPECKGYGGFGRDGEPTYYAHVAVCGKCAGTGKWKEPIEYGGIFDGLVEFSKQVYIFEHKTTSMLGPTYFNQFNPNNQVTGYIWAARQLSGLRVGGAIVNAICVTKTGKTKFERHLTVRTDAQIERWLEDLRVSCNEIRYHDRTGKWPMRTPSCTQYGMCSFHSVHTIPTEAEQLIRLEQDYIKRPWDFESRDDSKEESPK